jgi:hypothetical protein
MSRTKRKFRGLQEFEAPNGMTVRLRIKYPCIYPVYHFKLSNDVIPLFPKS